jgi:hypothetical protein
MPLEEKPDYPWDFHGIRGWLATKMMKDVDVEGIVNSSHMDMSQNP